MANKSNRRDGVCEAARRCADVSVALVVLVLLAPLFAVIAAAVVLGSPGNPFYGGWRIGKCGRRFRMWKFRTMISKADTIGPQITAEDDSRVTSVGRILRATKLDELPQFLNLLAGSMTLVGPRPEVDAMVALYTPEQRRVLKIKPGIMGLGQLLYTEESIAHSATAEEFYVKHLLTPKVQLEIEYINRRSLWGDVVIVLRTAGFVGRKLGLVLSEGFSKRNQMPVI